MCSELRVHSVFEHLCNFPQVSGVDNVALLVVVKFSRRLIQLIALIHMNDCGEVHFPHRGDNSMPSAHVSSLCNSTKRQQFQKIPQLIVWDKFQENK